MKKILLSLLFTVVSVFAFEELNIDNFESKLKDKNVIVDFHAVWCPPCKVLNKNLKDFAEIKSDNVTIYKLDVDKEPLITAQYNVKRLPTTIYFKNGKKVKSVLGIQTVNELLKNSKNYFELTK